MINMATIIITIIIIIIIINTRFSITRGPTRRHYRITAELTLTFCDNINKFNSSAD